jgi:hypothetical protein
MVAWRVSLKERHKERREENERKKTYTAAGYP